jgi:hypothetical protein
MTEQFANKADSTLNGAIDNSTTTIVVADGSRFPSTGNFRVLLGSDAVTGEIVIATARSSNTLTVIRGQEGTSAQSWADGTTATHILTAGAVYSLQQTLYGKTLHSSLETVGSPQDGYALTWVNTDGYWAPRPGSQWTTASATEIFTTKTVSIDEGGTLASAHGDGTAKLYVNGKILSTSVSAGEIPLTTQGFGYVSDATQSFTVPDGVTSLKIKMWGPGGGSGNYAGANGGGPGGYSTGLLSVTPGEVLTLVVGSGGGPTVSPSGNGGVGGWPGGGFGSRGDASGAGGGGFTGVFAGSMTQANALMIAGGGGGATGYSGGNGAGAGGGLVAGGSTSGTSVNGRGGTQGFGGADGNGNGAANTTIAAGSNGQSLPQSTINVVSTSGFPSIGIILVRTTAGIQTVTYTGVTGTSFTGCSGGTGTMATSNTVATGGTTIAAGSNGASLPQATINVGSTTGFPASGTILVLTSAGYQPVSYTGTTGTTFTGCAGGTGTMSTGNSVSLASAGSIFMGGVAFRDNTTSQSNDSGGGGSGYFGGGAGQGDGRSGGGGSGSIHATRVTNGSTTTGTNANVNGGSTLPPSTTDINYISGVGIGGAATGVGGTDGGDGYIVFIWGGITTVDLDSIDFGNTSSISTVDTNISIASAPNGTITLAPGSGTLTLQSASDFILSSGTSSLVLNTNSVQRIKAYPTGAIVVGPPETWNDTSSEAQAGFTGPIINMSAVTGGSITSTANQALVFNNAGFGTIQGHNGVTFRVNTSIGGFFDSNLIFRTGPSSNSTTTLHGASAPFVGADYFYMYNASGSAWGEIISGGSVHRSALQVLNNAAGGSATSGVALFAGGTSHSTPEYAGMGTIEQSGAATSGLIFTKLQGNGTGFASTGAIWQSGAWTIGRATNNDTSSEAQAGLTGPLLNITQTTGGSVTTVANQALLYNVAGVATLQGNAGHNFVTGTTSVASTNASKFITSLGRRMGITTVGTNVTVPDGYHNIFVPTLTAGITITLPSTPANGDTYLIKDRDGSATAFNIVIAGNGKNIEQFTGAPAASLTLNNNYDSVTLIYNGTFWSII